MKYNLITIVEDNNSKPVAIKIPCTEHEALYYMSSKAISSYIKARHSVFTSTKVYKVPFDRNLTYNKVEIVFN